MKALEQAFDGRLAVKLGSRERDLSVKNLAEIGVCRISIVPGLTSKDVDGFKKRTIRIMKGGKPWDKI